jgi:hypothetical protein
LVAELVRCPHTALACFAVYSVDKPIALRLSSVVTVVLWVTQKTRGHARPESEDDEGNQVAHGHGSSSRLVQSRTGGNVVSPDTAGHDLALASGGEVVQEDEKENSSRNMNERVDAVDPVEESGTLEEPLLERQLPEDMQTLLEVNELKSMFASHMNGAFYESQSREGPAELVDLHVWSDTGQYINLQNPPSFVVTANPLLTQ